MISKHFKTAKFIFAIGICEWKKVTRDTPGRAVRLLGRYLPSDAKSMFEKL